MNGAVWQTSDHRAVFAARQESSTQVTLIISIRTFFPRWHSNRAGNFNHMALPESGNSHHACASSRPSSWGPQEIGAASWCQGRNLEQRRSLQIVRTTSHREKHKHKTFKKIRTPKNGERLWTLSAPSIDAGPHVSVSSQPASVSQCR
jgi:hypothetical protein